MFLRLRVAARGGAIILGWWLAAAVLYGQAAAAHDSFRFAILGDRTGETQAGVFEQVCREAAAERPAFILGVGDTIQGMDDAGAEAEWSEATRLLRVFGPDPLYLAPGNHDVWSSASERLFRRYAGHPLHYSFDYGQAHFTILDNSRSDELPAAELAFLQGDLKDHAGQPLKIVISHRPSWLLNVAVGNPEFPLHQLAKRYGVSYLIAGHLHQMLRMELQGVTYVSMASSGGHLRLTRAYEDGWFFGYALVTVRGNKADFEIREVGAPLGEGRVTKLGDWGMTGLVGRGR